MGAGLRCYTGIVLLAVAALALQAQAKMADSAELLAQHLDALTQLHAQFDQRRYDGRGMEMQRSQGRFWAERPDRFRWEVSAPFEEILIGDGETIWLWDPDLDQVTVRPYDERLRSTPASLLSGAVEDLLEDFSVQHSVEDGLIRFRLQPRARDALFEELEMIFDDGNLRWLVIHDGMGQYTEITLTEVRSEFEQNLERFRFVIPEGVDVLHEAGHPGAGNG